MVREGLGQRSWIALGALLLLLAGAAIGWAASRSSSSSAEPVVRNALAQTPHPRGAPGRTLGLSRVLIKPGAELVLHHHRGTQIAFIKSGVLNYTVHAGLVRVRRGAADEHPKLVRTIHAGQTARLRPGQWIVEQPSDHHSAANRGHRTVVIYLATLLRIGADPSTPG